jgi:hypothetical protein
MSILDRGREPRPITLTQSGRSHMETSTLRHNRGCQAAGLASLFPFLAIDRLRAVGSGPRTLLTCLLEIQYGSLVR